MKPRHFKIRTPQSQSQEQPKVRRNNQSDKHITLSIGQSIQSSLNDEDNQLKQFFKLFKNIMNKQKEARGQPEKHYKMDLEPRDREIVIEPPTISNGRIQEKELKKWIASVFKTVTSAAFNYYSKKEMNFQHAKIFCSENIFKNITNLSRHYTLSAKELSIIDHHVERSVLNYLGTKYPLTDSTNINKKLEEIIHQVDNIEALPNNYLNSSKVQFQYRDDGNYNDLIMKLMNELIEFLDLETEDQKTNYHQFQEFMTGVFQKVMDEDWMQKKDKENMLSNLKLSHQKSDIGSMRVELVQREDQNAEAFKQRLRKRNQEKEKYRASVKQYTHYLIGRKIPQHTQKYSKKEIQSGNMTIKSPTVLRILTKWCEELWQKFSQVGYYSSRSESIKILKGGNVNSLLGWMRKNIDAKLATEKQEIIKFTENIQENNYEMQSKILKMELSMQDCDYVQQLQKACGKFSSKVVKNVHSYILAYLNRLIHGLISVAKQFHTQNGLGEFSFWSSPPNLLTFRIGDLMRCKISSKEKEIVRIYKQFQSLSKQNPEKFKVIRIKNRLKKGTNDVLINFKFNNSITCEVQLAVKGYTSDFIKCSNNFHHYLYQLERSNFGPLTELCSIWNNLDKRAQIFEQMIEQQKNHKPAEHICKKLNKKTSMKVYTRPFICNECSVAYFHNNYLKSHIKCANCEYYVCSNCQIEKKSDEEILNQLMRDSPLRRLVQKRIDKTQRLPQMGVCVFLQSKLPRQQFFQYVNYQRNKKDYLIGTKDGQIYEIQKIQTAKKNKQFRKKHVIFELADGTLPTSPQLISIYFLTKTMKQNFKKQKQSISLMDQDLNALQCSKILSIGTKSQKENVKNLFLTDNRLNNLPFDPEEFPNISWLTLSRNTGISLSGIEKLQRLKNLILVNVNFQNVPEEIYQSSSIQELSMATNTITILQDKISNLKNLRVLQLDQNQLQQIPKEIKECRALKTVKIQSNNLQELPQELFVLQNLEILLLDKNQIKNIPDSIGNAANLKQLSISSNGELSQLPNSFFKLVNLQKLNVSSTQIKQLTDNVQNFQKLVELNISHTNISKIPASFVFLRRLQRLQMTGLKGVQNVDIIAEIKSLKALNISDCGLIGIPTQLKELQHIQSFTASDNTLYEINSQLFTKMLSLNKLDLCNCQLRHFPNLRKQKMLISIYLSSNQINEIPNQSLQSCKFLQTFVMTNNRLRNLPHCFKEFNKLITLDLKDNELANLLESSEFQEEIDNSQALIWPKLGNLFLNNNCLTKIPKFVCKNPSIAQFYFSNNNISVLPQQICHMKKLRQLEANSNQIAVLPQGLSSLQNLIGIYMSHNQVKHVSACISKIANLTAIYLDNNGVETIECANWILEKEYSIQFNQLAEIAYKIVNGRGRYQYQEPGQVENLQNHQNNEENGQMPKEQQGQYNGEEVLQ